MRKAIFASARRLLHLSIFFVAAPFLATGAKSTPQKVIEESDKSYATLMAQKEEIASNYNRLVQSVQRLQFQANTYPSDSNQMKGQIRRLARQYLDTLDAMIALCVVEIDAYERMLADPSNNRDLTKDSINRVKCDKRNLENERAKLIADGFVD